ncbi:hypothetical protein [Pseudomonas arsenicoxydans]|uniref:Uncharacterized protein n=1 Tax=Pseudomonas arsenicoxydans TaxID=702115 RepID=A0A502GVS1_9PSED|nr:hypothetical protein [Pseudomonas arsenicoxydans]TPG65715.1 hypothetical protein EAH78_31515 [Pseudomonas arsenicoxydans]
MLNQRWQKAEPPSFNKGLIHGSRSLVVTQIHNATMDGEMQDMITGLRRSVVAKTWIGSDDVNTLQILSGLINMVVSMTPN